MSATPRRRPGPHTVHSHAVHLPLRALLTGRTRVAQEKDTFICSAARLQSPVQSAACVRNHQQMVAIVRSAGLSCLTVNQMPPGKGHDSPAAIEPGRVLSVAGPHVVHPHTPCTFH